MTVDRADLIIIGGGLMGVSTAFFAATRGASVILLEAGLTGRQASGTNFGAVRRQGRPLEQLSLTNRSRAVWHRLPELIDDNCEFVSRGHLRIALDDASAAEMEAYALRMGALGLESEILGPAALKARFPHLSDNIPLGTFATGDGHANPRLAGPAFARAAQRLGCDIRENAPVRSAQKVGEDFEVELISGELCRAPALLVTAGAWSRPFAAAFGEEVNLTIKGPQLSVTEPLPYFMASNVSVHTHTPHEHIYFRQVKRGNIIMGGPFWGPASVETMTAAVEPEIPLLQHRQVARWLPIIRKTRIIRCWSGVESYTADGNPVMGASERHSGLYYAYGFSGAGFQLGPGVGETMAELIVTGRTDIDLNPFRASRFNPTADGWKTYGD